MDKSLKYLSPDESPYLLNHDVNNDSAGDKATPLGANYLACEMELPAGENYNNGAYHSQLTNETYHWTINSNGVNFISRINGQGECEVVWSGPEECLPLSAEPRHYIKEFRAHLKYDKICANRHGKQLIWVDGTDSPIGMLDVEASIATNSFTTPFFDVCPDDCAPLQLCVPKPSACLSGDFVPYSSDDAGKTNNIVDRGFKFIYQHVYYDQRVSEWSDISSLHYLDSKGCFYTAEGISRCIRFRLPVGNPMVERINFGVSYDNGATWYQYDAVEKYKRYSSAQEYWYERALSEEVASTFDESDCSFDYFFCNDKQRYIIDTAQVIRIINPMPRGTQCLLPIKNSLGFVNYKKGTCPIDKSEADKFDISLNCEDVSGCEPQFSKVTVRAIVYCPGITSPVGSVFRTGGVRGDSDDKTDQARFGSSGHVNSNQGFIGDTRNFIAYIEGTDYWGEMEQWEAGENFVSPKKVGVLAGYGAQNSTAGSSSAGGSFNYQEYTFTVPKGTKGFIRLVSHLEAGGAGENQSTSTHTLGTLGKNGLKSFNATSLLPNIASTPKEIYFDTCAGDVDSFDAIVVADLTPVSNSLIHSGYVVMSDGTPVEGAVVYISVSEKCTTDWNGFYFFGSTAAETGIDVTVESDCASPFRANPNGVYTVISKADGTSASGIYRKLVLNLLGYGPDTFYSNVTVRVNDCNNNPIKGIRIAMSGSKYKSTGSDGIARFKIRNYESRARAIKYAIMDSKNCFSLGCDNGCNPCMPSGDHVLSACFSVLPPLSVVVSTKINITNATGVNRGLKRGGRYPFGWVAEGDCGRVSAVNVIAKNGGYFDIPRFQDNAKNDFCRFVFNANGMKLPSWVTRLKIVRGTNVNPYTLQWLVDDIDRSINGKIKITIQSLNDYNAQYNFKSNTIYKYLQGDRVEFIQNGDGKVFDKNIYGLLNYSILNPFKDDVLSGASTDVNYFNQILIEDDGKLDKLAKGAKIELQPGTESVDEPAYFEICNTIPVIDGELAVQSGVFDTFDTYLVRRQIGKFPLQYFESKTPSDFWGGSAIDDTGRVHFINKYENERRYGRNISLNAAGQFNYFGDVEKTLDAALQGDIIGVNIKDDKIGLAICENDNFIFQISDQLLRVGSDNVIYAASGDSLISNPEAKIIGEYGCSYDDIGSILFGDGFATYICEKTDQYIIHNYSSAKPVGITVEKGGEISTSCNSFFKRRIREKVSVNRTSQNVFDKYRFSSGINRNTNIVFLTLKALRNSGVNNNKAPFLAANDTIMYNPLKDEVLGFASFTPEGYSHLNLESDTGCSFVTFQNSLPYIHPSLPEKYNEFFGVPCDWVVGVSLNKDPGKIKIPLAIELQSGSMFYVSSVTTEEGMFASEVPASRWRYNNGKFNASFLNNVNSRGGLFNGTPARGYFVNVLFVRDNTLNLAYSTIDNDKRVAYSELDYILFKFMASEQSGFDQNL